MISTRFKTVRLKALGLIALNMWSAQILAAPPYPPSQVIANITWDHANAVRLAPGSDLWPVTWAADGNLYTSWGDGGGFGGTNSDGRVSLGFARIEGPPEKFVASNVWGGKNAGNPAQFNGKAVGMLSVNNILYAWINNEIYDPRQDYGLAWSTDIGRTWQQADWAFKGEEFGETSFLNFGRDYDGARDNFVYVYGTGSPSDPVFSTELMMARVPKDQISVRSAYEFFAGWDGNSNPIWNINIANRRPVFEDPNGVGMNSVSYNPGLNRYLLTEAHDPWVASQNSIQKLGIFDAAEPWGPWTTVQYNDNWGSYTGPWLGYYIPTKTPDWMSTDGKTIHLIFSGIGAFDSFNLIKGSIILRGTTTSVPNAPTGISVKIRTK